MNLMYSLDILKTLEDWSAKLEEWITNNYGNPLLWVGILAVGVVFLRVVLMGMNKNE